MQFAKRIFLFLAVNLAIMITISVILNVLGVGPYLTAYGIDYTSLMIFCLAWGMGGAFISLGLSRIMAKWTMGVRIVDPNTTDETLQGLVATVHQLSRSAGLSTMPQVGIYDSPEVNAFATGPTRSRSLVAVSTGLLGRMSREEVEGVLGHEIAHVANGDMVTLTLIQGVINAFVMFMARAIAFAISQALRGDRDREGAGIGGMAHFAIVMVLEIVFAVIGSMIVAAFSRWREFRADAGGARLAGRDAMVAALRKLQAMQERVDEQTAPSFNAMKISGRPSRFTALFSTHPPLASRIAALEART